MGMMMGCQLRTFLPLRQKKDDEDQKDTGERKEKQPNE
jgi:hypothetical protein